MQKDYTLTDKDENDNVVDFSKAKLLKLATGGKGSDGMSPDWLRALPENSRFLGKNKKDGSPNLLEYNLLRHVYDETTECNSTELLVRLPDGNEVMFWVDSLVFSNQVNLQGILEVSKDE